MKVSTQGRTPLFDEVLVEGSVLEHYLAEREDYGELLTELSVSSEAMRDKIGHRCIWHINSTAFGGGVAEMLPHHICLLRELGFDARWLVFKPKEEQFFQFTKGVHNSLHDAAAAGLDELLPYYLAASKQGAAELEGIIRPDDVLVVHDPQPLCAVSQFLEAHPHPAIWRCHVGHPKRTPTVDNIWGLLEKYLRPFQRVVLSNKEYAFETSRPIDIIQPSISPFSVKNRDHDGPPGRTLEHSVSFNGYAFEPNPSLRDMLGSRYFLHVSRWDGLKGIDRTIAAFARFITATAVDEAGDLRLVIAGPDPVAVSDDPEGRECFDKCVALCSQLPEAVRRRVYLACISMEDNDANAEIVGRLQQGAHGVFQLSREEGFGLTTTEALFRGKPVVVSSAFGLKAQIGNGLNGVVLDEPDIEDKAAEMMRRLATAYGDFEEMARAARAKCLRSSTQISQMPKWYDAIQSALSSFEGRAGVHGDGAAGAMPSRRAIGQDDRATRLKQSPVCFWLTGLSGAGKSTIAGALESRLWQGGNHTYVVDADIARQGLNANLGFSHADRSENVRRLGHLAHSIVDAGLIVIVTAISPFSRDRALVRALFRPHQFFEVHVSTDLATCVTRDTKGLYARARQGQLRQLTGWDDPYEAPQAPDVRIDTAEVTVEDAVRQILDAYRERER
ncbi:MAG TPA: adenylyl-sulfate kinase [Duganella sp.]|nr:adenylyl-sulfate kinase [Duganella sp.]